MAVTIRRRHGERNVRHTEGGPETRRIRAEPALLCGGIRSRMAPLSQRVRPSGGCLTGGILPIRHGILRRTPCAERGGVARAGLCVRCGPEWQMGRQRSAQRRASTSRSCGRPARVTRGGFASRNPTALRHARHVKVAAHAIPQQNGPAESLRCQHDEGPARSGASTLRGQRDNAASTKTDQRGGVSVTIGPSGKGPARKRAQQGKGASKEKGWRDDQSRTGKRRPVPRKHRRSPKTPEGSGPGQRGEVPVPEGRGTGMCRRGREAARARGGARKRQRGQVASAGKRQAEKWQCGQVAARASASAGKCQRGEVGAPADRRPAVLTRRPRCGPWRTPRRSSR